MDNKVKNTRGKMLSTNTIFFIIICLFFSFFGYKVGADIAERHKRDIARRASIEEVKQ